MPSFFVINLDRSADRLAMISSGLETTGIKFTRIAALDGGTIPETQWEGFDKRRWQRSQGKVVQPGEYGCFSSHRRAWKAFLEGSSTTAVVFEDDAVPSAQLKPFCDALDARFGDENMLVRLVSHRIPLFEKLEFHHNGIELGQCWFGPTGSAAAYWLTRPAAERLLAVTQTFYLPVDIMVERAWETGVPAFMTRPAVVSLNAEAGTLIGGYRSTGGRRKSSIAARLSTYFFRTRQFFERIAWSAKTRRLPGS